MVKIETTYLGDLRCEAVHGPSGTRLHTDAPKDNHGKGESFSPTDLVATAIGSCILTVMGIAARSMNVDLTGARVSVEKHMAQAPVRRIARLAVHVHLPAKLPPDQMQKLEHTAHTCPVHQSLHPEVEKPITFTWGN